MSGATWRIACRHVGALALGTVVLLGFVVSESVASPGTSELVPATGRAAGHSYAYWEVAAFRWRVSLPNVTSNKPRA
jgi:hypothetical protein